MCFGVKDWRKSNMNWDALYVSCYAGLPTKDETSETQNFFNHLSDFKETLQLSGFFSKFDSFSV